MRNHTVEVAHQPRQVRAARVQHEVILIAHQAIVQHLLVRVVHALLQYAEQGSTVAVVLENWLALVAAGGDVVARPRELDAQGAEHGAKRGKRQDLITGFVDRVSCAFLKMIRPVSSPGASRRPISSIRLLGQVPTLDRR